MEGQAANRIEFCGTSVLLVREAEVRVHLSIGSALADLREALASEVVNRPRIRIDSRDKGRAWLHTLRAGLPAWDVAGGKDYTSIGFETPAMWVSVIDTRTGLPVAFVEADLLSRIRTAAVTGLATGLLAPPSPVCLAQFGAGKIAQHLVQAVLHVRPSIRKVLLVRKRESVGAPEWLSALGSGVEGHLVEAEEALAEADVVTTATSSATPVIPAGAALPRLRHLNLIGSNHLKRREIDVELARRCLPPAGFLMTDDPEQAEAEAGDFVDLVAEGALRWGEIPTLARLVADSALRDRAKETSLTAFKSVGIGLMDLIVAAGLLRRLGQGGSNETLP
jgi:ornithine cyclodeaminase/alanine dehydrogenase-like protein (mu-crystallin family)